MPTACKTNQAPESVRKRIVTKFLWNKRINDPYNKGFLVSFPGWEPPWVDEKPPRARVWAWRLRCPHSLGTTATRLCLAFQMLDDWAACWQGRCPYLSHCPSPTERWDNSSHLTFPGRAAPLLPLVAHWVKTQLFGTILLKRGHTGCSEIIQILLHSYHYGTAVSAAKFGETNSNFYIPALRGKKSYSTDKGTGFTSS